MVSFRRRFLLKIFKGECHAFTFVEMLLVVALLSTVGLSVYHTFADGLKIWERSQESIDEEDIAIFFDKISEDMRNAVRYSLIPFEGGEHQISFAAIITTSLDRKKKITSEVIYIPEIGRITYFFDPLEKCLYRQEANYSQAVNKKKVFPRSLVKNIASLKFGYYYQAGTGHVLEAHGKDILPSAIKIDIEFGQETRRRSMTRLVSIPIGS